MVSSSAVGATHLFVTRGTVTLVHPEIRRDCTLGVFFSAPSASLRYALLIYPSSIHVTKPARRLAAPFFPFPIFPFPLSSSSPTHQSSPNNISSLRTPS